MYGQFKKVGKRLRCLDGTEQITGIDRVDAFLREGLGGHLSLLLP